MNLVAGPIEEAGVDERHTVAGVTNTFFEIDGGAPLLVHDAHLQGVSREAEGFLNSAEQLGGERHFVGTVHLGLHDVDRAGAAVPVPALALQVVEGDQGSHHPIQQPFINGLAAPAGGVDGHQMANVADQHQGAAGQDQLRDPGHHLRDHLGAGEGPGGGPAAGGGAGEGQAQAGAHLRAARHRPPRGQRGRGDHPLRGRPRVVHRSEVRRGGRRLQGRHGDLARRPAVPPLLGRDRSLEGPAAAAGLGRRLHRHPQVGLYQVLQVS